MMHEIVQIISSLRHPLETTEIEPDTETDWRRSRDDQPGEPNIPRPRPRQKDDLPKQARGQISPGFKLIFITVVTITVLSGVGQIVLAGIWLSPTPDQQSAFEALDFAWKAGIGAIFGLLGGKAV
jgi:hypothetical protein